MGGRSGPVTAVSQEKTGRGLSMHPALAWQSKGGVLSRIPALANAKGATVLLTPFFLFPPMQTKQEPVSALSVLQSVRASLPPARISRVASGVTRAHLRFPSSSLSLLFPAPGAPWPPPRARPHPLARTAPRIPSHLLSRSSGTLRPRPAPGRPAARPALTPARLRAPAALPPLTACFREPGRALASAMMAPSRDGDAPPSRGEPGAGAPAGTPRAGRAKGTGEAATKAVPGPGPVTPAPPARGDVRRHPGVKAHFLSFLARRARGKMAAERGGAGASRELRCPDPSHLGDLPGRTSVRFRHLREAVWCKELGCRQSYRSHQLRATVALGQAA